MRGIKRANALAGQATSESTLTLDTATVLSLVCENIEASRDDASNTTLSLKEKGIKRGAGRNSLVRGPARRLSNQLLTGTISLHTLRWTLQRRGEHLWECLQCYDPCSSLS